MTPNSATDAIKMEFARRLQRAMVAKGLNQSELARRAAHFAPEEHFIRDNVSKYMRGKVLPGPVHLNALCKALGIDKHKLLPQELSFGSGEETFSVRDRGDGRALLSVSMTVSWAEVLKIREFLRELKSERS